MWSITAYPVEVLGVLLSPLGLIVLVIGYMIGSLVPALINKLVMAALFRETVAFWPIFAVMVGIGMLATVTIVLLCWAVPYLLSGDASVAYIPEGWLATLLTTALLVLVQSYALGFAAPNQNGQLMATWVWLVTALVSWVVLVIAVLLITYLVVSNTPADQAGLNILPRPATGPLA